MKGVTIVFCIAVILISFSAIANADMVILNIVPKNSSHFVTVDYTNDTDEIYETLRIKCDALDKDENIINSKELKFSGPIKPGDKVAFKTLIESLGKTVDSIYCNRLGPNSSD